MVTFHVDLTEFVYNLIFLVVLGTIAGLVANVLMGRKGISFFSNLWLGIGGGLVGSVIMPMLGLYTWGFLGSVISAIIGAILILMAMRIFKKDTRWR